MTNAATATSYKDLQGEDALRYDLACYIYEEHKSVFGVKGRHYGLWTGNGYEVSPEWTTEALQAEAARMNDWVKESIEEDRRREERCIAHFQAAVDKCLEIGAADRATAIRWVKESYEDDGYGVWYGDEHLEFNMGLPYGYLKKEAELAEGPFSI